MKKNMPKYLEILITSRVQQIHPKFALFLAPAPPGRTQALATMQWMQHSYIFQHASTTGRQQPPQLKHHLVRLASIFSLSMRGMARYTTALHAQTCATQLAPKLQLLSWETLTEILNLTFGHQASGLKSLASNLLGPQASGLKALTSSLWPRAFGLKPQASAPPPPPPPGLRAHFLGVPWT